MLEMLKTFPKISTKLIFIQLGAMIQLISLDNQILYWKSETNNTVDMLLA